jgi:uncharacterized RDD family membrane protein YckC
MAQPPSASSQSTPPPPGVSLRLPGGIVVAPMAPRVGAFIVDNIILAIVGAAFRAVLETFGLWYSRLPANGDIFRVTYDYPVVLANVVFGLAISYAYWVYSWSARRATPGMRLVRLQIGQVENGDSLTTAAAARRWIVLGGPFALVSAVEPVTVLYYVLTAFEPIWLLVLLVTTATHPHRRGLHDRYAGSLIVQSV